MKFCENQQIYKIRESKGLGWQISKMKRLPKIANDFEPFDAWW